MITATELKIGKTFVMDDKPYKVTKYQHQKIARSGGTVKLSVRNLETGSLEEKTLKSSHKVDEISTLKRPLQFLYKDASSVVFMDEVTYEQVEIPLAILADELIYIKEGETVNVLFWDSRPLSIEIAPKVTLTIKETAPGVKGNTASNMYKPAMLENGLELKVPLFIKVGEKIRVDTRTGEYVERVK
ncbi:MAG: elongation factor P [Candidatus Omnitrophica bacterium]|nr:elongation factor P [Candidatus Omnitrophota bacterium]